MQSPVEGTEDPQYWERVLQSSFTSLVESEQKEREEYEKTLGRGKRLRKKINYYEKEHVSLLCYSYSPAIVMLITSVFIPLKTSDEKKQVKLSK